jgi:hypothetical protein
MNELFTKSFWRDVKKTFYTALEGAPAETEQPVGTHQTAAESNPTDAPTLELPTAPPNRSERN